ncbi:MAG: ShlB/FhaC/HecB family hemolysin secretion/activation protein [Nitrosospira sp.]|nr:ShlB/FhaC/HecB family hemolysin secretion/activation protein [Nitrosospira sp.]
MRCTSGWVKSSAVAFWLSLFLGAIRPSCVGAQEQVIPPASSSQVQHFPVKKIQVEGNTLLPDRELAALMSHLVGENKTLGDLQQGAAAIQQAYRKAGYGGVIAFVPEQELSSGDIVIQVVEGKIAKIEITDNQLYDETNIRYSLPHIRDGETPNIRGLDRDIQLANENPGKDLRVTLAAGEKPGEIDAKVKVAEEKSIRLLLGLDSSGTLGTNRFRTNIGIQHSNLWNRDHIGTFQFQTSPVEPSKVHVFSVGYRIPFYGNSAALDMFFAHSNISSVSATTPAGPLGFTGSGDVGGFRLHRYLSRMGDYDHRVTFGWDWRHYNNNCSLGAFGSAGCGTAGADVTILPLSLGYTGDSQGPNLSWGFNVTASGNPGGSSNQEFNAARFGAERNYTVYRFAGFTNVALPAAFSLTARIAAQYSPDALVPGEQLGIGGAGSALGGIISVRGYREREVVGDYGSFLNLEALGPDVGRYINLWGVHLRPLVFFDVGWVGNNHHTRCMINDTSCTLAGVGGGIRLGYGKRFSARLDMGQALLDGNQTTANSSRGHMVVNFSF